MPFHNHHYPRVLTLSETIARITGLILTGIFFLLSGTSVVLAQLERVESGDRVKLSVPSMDTQAMDTQDIVGTVAEMSPSVLALSLRDSLLFIHTSLIKELAISKGQKRATGKGALIGAGTGALLLGVITASSSGSTESSCSDEEFYVI